jgi:hypothetical protein
MPIPVALIHLHSAIKIILLHGAKPLQQKKAEPLLRKELSYQFWQLGCLIFIRPVAFRPCFATGLALSVV